MSSMISESDRKTFVRVATTGNITLYGIQTIDGILIDVGDTVLVKNQSTPSENGVYFVKNDRWIRAPLQAGKLILVERGSTHTDSLWVLTADLPLHLDISALVFSELTNTGLVANIPSEAYLSVANVAALTALPVANLSTGIQVYVGSLDTNFRLDLSSVIAADGITVLLTSGAGRWLRTIDSSLKWANQLTWYVSPATGNDENSGQSGSPIKTLKELTRRLMGVIPTSYTVNLLDDVPSTDAFDFNPRTLQSGPAFAGTTAVISLTGTQTAAVSSTVVAAVGATPATNTPCSLQDASTAWGSHLGKLVKMTSGALNGRVAAVLKDLGSNTARLSPWCEPVTGVVSGIGVAPAPGDTFQVLSLTVLSAPVRLGAPIKARAQFSYLRMTPTIFTVELAFCNYFACEIAFNFSIGNQIFNSYHRFAGCAIKPSATTIASVMSRIEYRGCGLMDCDLVLPGWTRGLIYQCVFQNASIRIGRSPAGTSQQDGTQSAGCFIVNTLGAGFFDCVNAEGAISVTNGSSVNIEAPLWGSGNTLGLKVLSGAQAIFATTITPTLVATTELNFGGAVTALPGLEAAAGAMLPALAPLTTWAEWVAAPFNRNVMNYTNGTRIINQA